MKNSLNKYFALFITSVNDSLNYRTELLLWTVIDAIPLIAILMLWLSAFGNKSEILGYTKASLISYYVIGFVIQDITSAYFEENALKDIRQGTIVAKLIKPISLKVALIVKQLGWRVMTFITTVITFIVISKLIGNNLLSFSGFKFLYIMPIFLTFTYILDSIFSLMITSMGFVFEEASSLSHLKWMLGWLFSGSMIPFEFMPRWLAKIASLLPFQFKYYVPVKIIQGKFSLAIVIHYLIFEIFWIVILTIILNKLWSRNTKKFTAVGN